MLEWDVVRRAIAGWALASSPMPLAGLATQGAHEALRSPCSPYVIALIQPDLIFGSAVHGTGGKLDSSAFV